MQLMNTVHHEVGLIYAWQYMNKLNQVGTFTKEQNQWMVCRMNSPLFNILAKEKDGGENKQIHHLVKKFCSPTSTRGEFSVFSASLAYREWYFPNKWVWSEWRQQKRLAQKGEKKKKTQMPHFSRATKPSWAFYDQLLSRCPPSQSSWS